ncbi:hypothetical protein DLAC_04318 [Tieghemostelium lacteum]|uniref:Paramecium surface antigen repeat-containing protein n=1 Tax=Tieghemostelium lacteum TaxID=361077 RepID=A0A151ZJQ6_TIELA|nr:hypothetical protein DLAC_04318 [Tieghemostelium lacteum]|eukprot:KYQ94044.1 hypothetical protein DLAC_04318 [Tieghemostelium lacteum]
MKFQIVFIISLLILIDNVHLRKFKGSEDRIDTYGEEFGSSSSHVPLLQCPTRPYESCRETMGLDNLTCSHGYTCQLTPSKDRICKPALEEGQKCTIFYECNYRQLCIGKRCHPAYFLGAGGSCKKDVECVQSLYCLDGKCQPKVKNYCNRFSCPFNNHCMRGKCIPYQSVGSPCNNSTKLCDTSSFCHNEKCQSLFSLTLDEQCYENTQCNFKEGLYCSEESNRCQLAELTNSTQYCNYLNFTKCHSFEVCVAGKCEISLNINSECQDSIVELNKCIHTNKCPDIFKNGYENKLSPWSCDYLHCQKEICNKLIKCNPYSQCGESFQLCDKGYRKSSYSQFSDTSIAIVISNAYLPFTIFIISLIMLLL